MTRKKSSKRKIAPKPLPVRSKRPRLSLPSLIIAAGAILFGIYFLFFMDYSPPAFDGNRAFELLEKQCEFGPRVPGSDAHTRCGDYLVDELSRYADRVIEQEFHYRDKKDTSRVIPGRNIVASFNLSPAMKHRVLLCAHWDCRPWADRDIDSSRHDQPVMGANDGASGVAVLLEMARLLKAAPTEFGVDIILFDLEDMGDYGAEPGDDSLNTFCIGSRHFVDNNPTYRPRFGILVDMVGDKDLLIPQERFSQANAGATMERIWQAAATVGATAFVNTAGEAVMDDHYAFLEKGIPVVDVIDFEYPYWHTTEDTPDKCSVKSLQQVGNVLREVLYGEVSPR